MRSCISKVWMLGQIYQQFADMQIQISIPRNLQALPYGLDIRQIKEYFIKYGRKRLQSRW
ncbi:hypothetical protein, partial [Klebsiella pneumoniae]|uniref:hypothetical protein n=1 Tax=Klebsiella pneumoniae TaxID=573 RepID=UPI0030133C3A